MVVGNIDNCHLSKAILNKTNRLYRYYESTLRNMACIASLCCFGSADDILIVTPSDHIIDMDSYTSHCQATDMASRFIL
jgi:mannose-1-phosphate guanylyltransferase